ncbi:hypothetical protein OC835_004645 [Tilletia horrida]|nr:hypothetical protein OC835_004645 [Tilletia horrida]KAK0560498.1 hypothetical protein OC844_003724 [Tilletia horrida]
MEIPLALPTRPSSGNLQAEQIVSPSTLEAEQPGPTVVADTPVREYSAPLPAPNLSSADARGSSKKPVLASGFFALKELQGRQDNLAASPDEVLVADGGTSVQGVMPAEAGKMPAGDLEKSEKGSERHSEDPPASTDGQPFDPLLGDPFPLSDLVDEANDQSGLTLRAVLIGCFLGLIIAASNLYIGLQTGQTFLASLFAAIFGFSLLQLLNKILPAALGGGAPSGPREVCTVQSIANASAGLSGMFVAAVPAMYQLDLLSDSPRADIGRLFTFTLVSAFFGAFFAIPLRRFYILRLKLVFPTPTAAAVTIRSLHAVGGAAKAKKQVRLLGVAFAAALIWCVCNQYAPGILYEWHWAYWLYQWGWKKALVVDNFNWYFQTTPAFFGAGMLAGLNASLSFLLGSVLLWGIIAPALIQTGQAQGKVIAQLDGGYVTRVSYNALDWQPGQDLNTASPRYWGLWVGVLMMFAASAAELAMNAPAIGRSGARAARAVWDVLRHGGRTEQEEKEEGEALLDPAPPEDQVPWWMWTGGLVLSIVLTCVVCGLYFDMSVGISILTIVLSFVFAFVVLSVSGTTDNGPIATVAKASQLIVGGAMRDNASLSVNDKLLHNLIAGSIVSSAGQHANDMVSDLKTGHLLRARPRTQFYGQLVGSIPGIFISPGLFILFASAYPCITNPDLLDTCQFSLPSVTSWVAVARAVLSPSLPISLSSGLTAIGFAVLAILSVVARYRWVPRRYHVFIPSFSAMGVGFVLPQTYIPVALAMGALFALAWRRRRPEQFELYGTALASGFVAGEGIAGVCNAVLTVAKIDGGTRGSKVGYPVFR